VSQFIILTIGGLAASGIDAITAVGVTLTCKTTAMYTWTHGAIGMIWPSSPV
jgi:branched-subunit amino acid ABC-type transport system permease component